MSSAPFEVYSEMHSSSDEDLASLSSIKKDKDWVQAVLDAPIPLSTSTKLPEDEECSGADPEHKLRQLSPICKDVIKDLCPVEENTSRLEFENKALKRSLERVKCDKELQIANLTFQLNLRSKQLEEQSKELRNIQRMLEDNQRKVVQLEQQLTSALNENSSLKESRQEAFELVKKTSEQASTLTTENDILKLELTNEKKLRQAVESEHRSLSSNMLTRLRIAREGSLAAETEKDRLQEDSRKLKLQLTQLTEHHSQKTSTLQTEIECFQLQVKETQKTMDLKDSKLLEFYMDARRLLEMRFKSIEQALFIFEEELEDRISLVKDTYNSNQKNTIQRLDTIHHELTTCIQGLRPLKIPHFIERQPRKQDLSNKVVKLKGIVQNYAQAFQKQKEYCTMYDYIVKELVQESKALEAEFEVQCKSNKALKQQLQKAQIQITILTQKLKTNATLPTRSKSNFEVNQGLNSSSKKDDNFESKMKKQRAAIRKYKVQVSSLLAQREVLLKQTPTMGGTKMDIKDLVVRKIDPRMLETSFS